MAVARVISNSLLRGKAYGTSILVQKTLEGWLVLICGTIKFLRLLIDFLSFGEMTPVIKSTLIVKRKAVMRFVTSTYYSVAAIHHSNNLLHMSVTFV